jgi:hypothetical protein
MLMALVLLGERTLRVAKTLAREGFTPKVRFQRRLHWKIMIWERLPREALVRKMMMLSV